MAIEHNPGTTTLTAFFEDREDAQEAASRLRALGVSDASIRIVGDGETGSVDQEKGFWESLGEFLFPDEDRATYAEGLRRGGFLVTVTGLSGDQYDEALDILDDEGSVDVGERAEAWQSEGWSGTSFPSGGSSSGVGTSSETSARTETFGSGAGAALARGASTSETISDEDEVIPVIKEDLRVGKRDVNLGRVRVRSYVVEEPVSEQVTLRDDRIHIERRPVDRPVQDSDRMFTDKVLEAEEHTQEAVIHKEARVTEEIGLRRESEERSHTVSDTVRHTELEIEDERTEQQRRDDPTGR